MMIFTEFVSFGSDDDFVVVLPANFGTSRVIAGRL